MSISSNRKKYELKVIVLGLPRTGTFSTKYALEILGYKCYHGFDSVDKNHTEQWYQILVNKLNRKEIDVSGIFGKEYIACSDKPMSFLYKDLIDQNPDSKIILLERDSMEDWYKSFDENILYFIDPKRRPLLVKILCLFSSTQYYRFKVIDKIFELIGIRPTKEELHKYYYTYSNEIIEYMKSIGKDLLKYNVKQGWEPLCKFLGKEVPQQEFPFKNISSDFKIRQRRYEIKSGLIIFSFMSVISLSGLFVYNYILKC